LSTKQLTKLAGLELFLQFFVLNLKVLLIFKLIFVHKYLILNIDISITSISRYDGTLLIRYDIAIQLYISSIFIHFENKLCIIMNIELSNKSNWTTIICCHLFIRTFSTQLIDPNALLWPFSCSYTIFSFVCLTKYCRSEISNQHSRLTLFQHFIYFNKFCYDN
jgi:hypothetical protein